MKIQKGKGTGAAVWVTRVLNGIVLGLAASLLLFLGMMSAPSTTPDSVVWSMVSLTEAICMYYIAYCIFRASGRGKASTTI